MSDQPFSQTRRRFLGFNRRPSPVLPWADPARLLDLCSRCGACSSACPERIIVPADGGFPTVDFGRGACTFCEACARACPVPIFDLSREAWSYVDVRIGSACLAENGIVCHTCREACPSDAIRLRPVYRSAPRPQLDTDLCTACGACVSVCPTGAIAILPGCNEAKHA